MLLSPSRCGISAISTAAPWRHTKWCCAWTRTGKVYHCTGEHKRQIEFIQLREILDREFDAAVSASHIVLDNPRMHKGKLVKPGWASIPVSSSIIRRCIAPG
jgi:hypothetical protein